MSSHSPKKTALLYATVDTFNLDRGAGAFALAVCQVLGADLTSLLVNLDANVPPSKDGRSLAQMEEDSGLRAEANQHNASTLIDEAAGRGIQAEVVTDIDHSRGLIGWIADHARLHDLVIIGADSQGLLSDRIVAENLLFDIGRPLIVAPSDWTGDFDCSRIVVAWDNSRVCARALADALLLLPPVKEVVLLIMGGEKAIGSSLSDEAAVSVLERKGVKVRVVHRDLDDRDIGTALQEEATSLGAGLLAMGGYGHSRLRDFILGGATLSVFAKPTLPILLSH